jgi:DNA-binding MarR family transcriptional regulator
MNRRAPLPAAEAAGAYRLPPGPLSLGYLCSATLRLLHQIMARRLGRQALTPPQLGALLLILSAPRLSLAELARYTVGDSPTLCRILGRLEQRGLVRRARSAADRRRRCTELTPRGQRLGDLTRALYVDLEHQLLAGFEEREVAQLRALLTRVLRNAMSITAKDQGAP